MDKTVSDAYFCTFLNIMFEPFLLLTNNYGVPIITSRAVYKVLRSSLSTTFSFEFVYIVLICNS